MKKLVSVATALLLLAVLPAAAGAAVRSYNLTKNVAKAAIVVDDGDQVDCRLTCTQDTGTYPLECDGEGMCFPPSATVTAHLQPGWGVKSWSGCTAAGTACHVNMNTDQPKEVVVTFEDVADPAVALTAPADAARVRGSVQMAATAADNDGVQRVDFFAGGVKVASDATAPYTGSFDSTAFFDGAKELSAQSVDASGRVSTIAKRTVTIDNTRPTVSITGGTADGAVVGPPAAASFQFAAADATSPISAVECALDGGEFAACDSATAHALADLPAGGHTFHVRARDTAGNVGDAASRSFTVDLSAPDTAIESGRADGSSSTDTSAAFTFSASEAGASLGCRLYAFGMTPPAFADCSGGSFSTSGLTVGTYVFEVRAADAVGNADATPATRTFAVAAAENGGGGGGGGGGGTETPVVTPTPAPTPAPTPTAPVIPPAAERLDPSLHWEWDWSGGRTHAIMLRVAGVPKGAAVEVRCKGKGCPFALKKFAYRRAKVAIGPAMKRRRMSPGTKLEVRIVRRGAIGKVVVFTMRKGKRPTFKELCLPPGATAPAAC